MKKRKIRACYWIILTVTGVAACIAAFNFKPFEPSVFAATKSRLCLPQHGGNTLTFIWSAAGRPNDSSWEPVPNISVTLLKASPQSSAVENNSIDTPVGRYLISKTEIRDYVNGDWTIIEPDSLQSEEIKSRLRADVHLCNILKSEMQAYD